MNETIEQAATRLTEALGMVGIPSHITSVTIDKKQAKATVTRGQLSREAIHKVREQGGYGYETGKHFTFDFESTTYATALILKSNEKKEEARKVLIKIDGWAVEPPLPKDEE